MQTGEEQQVEQIREALSHNPGPVYVDVIPARPADATEDNGDREMIASIRAHQVDPGGVKVRLVGEDEARTPDPSVSDPSVRGADPSAPLPF